MLYRNFIAAVAALGLATSVFAADESASQMAPSNAPAMQTEAQPTTAMQQSRLNINTADFKQLRKVVGARRARDIIEYRKKNGDFKSLDDLSKVKGFARAKGKRAMERMREMREKLSVE